MTTPLIQSEAFATCLAGLGRPPARLGPHYMHQRRALGLTVSMLSRIPAPDRALIDMLPRGVTLLSPDAPSVPLARVGALPLVAPFHIAELDLTPDPYRLRAGLGQKWRNRLVRAETQPLRVNHQPFSGAPDHWLLRADAAQRKARGHKGWPPALTCAFCQSDRGNSRLFTATNTAGQPVAAMLFLRHGTGATYHIGHTTPEGRAGNAHNLVMWKAVCWLKTRGHDLVELGMIDTEAAPTLARFKLGTGAKVRRLGGTWAYLRGVAPLLRPLSRWDWTLMGLDRAA